MGNKLLIGTNNPAKLQEMSAALVGLDLECTNPDALGIKEKPVEDGESLSENAFIKAKFFSDISGLVSLGDDSGLEIDGLDGEPGIFVRRWPGHEATDAELIEYCLDKMKDVPKEKRGAQFRCVVCLYNPETKEKSFFEGVIKGVIAEKPFSEHKPGYPFDSLFFIPETGRYLAETKLENRISIGSHRAKAVRDSIPEIKKIFNLQ